MDLKTSISNSDVRLITPDVHHHREDVSFNIYLTVSK